jgi:excinuclease ABC subunit C
VPAELIVPAAVRETERLASFLESLRGAKVDVRQAERGDKRRLQELADRNAALTLAHERLREERTRERRLGALTALEGALALEGPPLRIEGYDISNLGAENIVAAMVVFEGGVPKKSDYRKFAIRSTEGQDDVGAIREALTRRFTRDAEPPETAVGNTALRSDAAEAVAVRDVAEAADGRGAPAGGRTGSGAAAPGAGSHAARPYDPSFEAVPDLILIDGGKGQLGGALAALRDKGLEAAVTVISLAKREEEVFAPWSPDPLDFAEDDPGLLLLRRVRDEAHRFALGFHRSKRAAATTVSLLDQLPGIGEKRKKAIVQYFGSPERFLQASREELEAVPGLPGKVAREIYAYVHKTG